ncbi:Fic family protein [Nocardia sp. NPDC003963]
MAGVDIAGLVDFIPAWLLEALNFGFEYPDTDHQALFALEDEVWRWAAEEFRELIPLVEALRDSVVGVYEAGEGRDEMEREFRAFIDGEGDRPALADISAGMDGLADFTGLNGIDVEYTKILMGVFAGITAYMVFALLRSMWTAPFVPLVIGAGRTAIATLVRGVTTRAGLRTAVQALKPALVTAVKEIGVKPLLVQAGRTGLRAGMAGAALDAGIQAYQLTGHRDSMNWAQTARMAAGWAGGGVVAAPVGMILSRGLGREFMVAGGRRSRVADFVRPVAAGVGAGAAGAGGAYLADLAFQYVVGGFDAGEVNTTFHPQMLAAGVALGGLSGARQRVLSVAEGDSSHPAVVDGHSSRPAPGDGGYETGTARNGTARELDIPSRDGGFGDRPLDPGRLELRSAEQHAASWNEMELARLRALLGGNGGGDGPALPSGGPGPVTPPGGGGASPGGGPGGGGTTFGGAGGGPATAGGGTRMAVATLTDTATRARTSGAGAEPGAKPTPEPRARAVEQQADIPAPQTQRMTEPPPTPAPDRGYIHHTEQLRGVVPDPSHESPPTTSADGAGSASVPVAGGNSVDSGGPILPGHNNNEDEPNSRPAPPNSPDSPNEPDVDSPNTLPATVDQQRHQSEPTRQPYIYNPGRSSPNEDDPLEWAPPSPSYIPDPQRAHADPPPPATFPSPQDRPPDYEIPAPGYVTDPHDPGPPQPDIPPDAMPAIPHTPATPPDESSNTPVTPLHPPLLGDPDSDRSEPRQPAEFGPAPESTVTAPLHLPALPGGRPTDSGATKRYATPPDTQAPGSPDDPGADLSGPGAPEDPPVDSMEPVALHRPKLSDFDLKKEWARSGAEPTPDIFFGVPTGPEPEYGTDKQARKLRNELVNNAHTDRRPDGMDPERWKEYTDRRSKTSRQQEFDPTGYEKEHEEFTRREDFTNRVNAAYEEVLASELGLLASEQERRVNLTPLRLLQEEWNRTEHSGLEPHLSHAPPVLGRTTTTTAERRANRNGGNRGHSDGVAPYELPRTRSTPGNAGSGTTDATTDADRWLVEAERWRDDVRSGAEVGLPPGQHPAPAALEPESVDAPGTFQAWAQRPDLQSVWRGTDGGPVYVPGASTGGFDQGLAPNSGAFGVPGSDPVFGPDWAGEFGRRVADRFGTGVDNPFRGFGRRTLQWMLDGAITRGADPAGGESGAIGGRGSGESESDRSAEDRAPRSGAPTSGSSDRPESGAAIDRGPGGSRSVERMADPAGPDPLPADPVPATTPSADGVGEPIDPFDTDRLSNPYLRKYGTPDFDQLNYSPSPLRPEERPPHDGGAGSVDESKSQGIDEIATSEQEARITELLTELGVGTGNGRLLEAGLFIDDHFLSVAAVSGQPRPELIFGVDEWIAYLLARVAARRYGHRPLTVDFIIESHRRLSQKTSPTLAGNLAPNKSGGLLQPLTESQLAAVAENPRLSYREPTFSNPYGGIDYTDYVTTDGVRNELESLCSWYNEAVSAPECNAIALAATLQCQFISIHPFSDYNGRLSRILMNWSLESSGHSASAIEEFGDDYLSRLPDWEEGVARGIRRYEQWKSRLEEFGNEVDPVLLFDLGKQYAEYHLLGGPIAPFTPGENHSDLYFRQVHARIMKSPMDWVDYSHDERQGHPKSPLRSDTLPPILISRLHLLSYAEAPRALFGQPAEHVILPVEVEGQKFQILLEGDDRGWWRVAATNETGSLSGKLARRFGHLQSERPEMLAEVIAAELPIPPAVPESRRDLGKLLADVQGAPGKVTIIFKRGHGSRSAATPPPPRTILVDTNAFALPDVQTDLRNLKMFPDEFSDEVLCWYSSLDPFKEVPIVGPVEIFRILKPGGMLRVKVWFTAGRLDSEELQGTIAENLSNAGFVQCVFDISRYEIRASKPSPPPHLFQPGPFGDGTADFARDVNDRQALEPPPSGEPETGGNTNPEQIDLGVSGDGFSAISETEGIQVVRASNGPRVEDPFRGFAHRTPPWVLDGAIARGADPDGGGSAFGGRGSGRPAPDRSAEDRAPRSGTPTSGSPDRPESGAAIDSGPGGSRSVERIADPAPGAATGADRHGTEPGEEAMEFGNRTDPVPQAGSDPHAAEHRAAEYIRGLRDLRATLSPLLDEEKNLELNPAWAARDVVEAFLNERILAYRESGRGESAVRAGDILRLLQSESLTEGQLQQLADLLPRESERGRTSRFGRQESEAHFVDRLRRAGDAYLERYGISHVMFKERNSEPALAGLHEISARVLRAHSDRLRADLDSDVPTAEVLNDRITAEVADIARATVTQWASFAESEIYIDWSSGQVRSTIGPRVAFDRVKIMDPLLKELVSAQRTTGDLIADLARFRIPMSMWDVIRRCETATTESFLAAITEMSRAGVAPRSDLRRLVDEYMSALADLRQLMGDTYWAASPDEIMDRLRTTADAVLGDSADDTPSSDSGSGVSTRTSVGHPDAPIAEGAVPSDRTTEAETGLRRDRDPEIDDLVQDLVELSGILSRHNYSATEHTVSAGSALEQLRYEFDEVLSNRREDERGPSGYKYSMARQARAISDLIAQEKLTRADVRNLARLYDDGTGLDKKKIFTSMSAYREALIYRAAVAANYDAADRIAIENAHAELSYGVSGIEIQIGNNSTAGRLTEELNELFDHVRRRTMYSWLSADPEIWTDIELMNIRGSRIVEESFEGIKESSGRVAIGNALEVALAATDRELARRIAQQMSISGLRDTSRWETEIQRYSESVSALRRELNYDLATSLDDMARLRREIATAVAAVAGGDRSGTRSVTDDTAGVAELPGGDSGSPAPQHVGDPEVIALLPAVLSGDVEALGKLRGAVHSLFRDLMDEASGDMAVSSWLLDRVLERVIDADAPAEAAVAGWAESLAHQVTAEYREGVAAVAQAWVRWAQHADSSAVPGCIAELPRELQPVARALYLSENTASAVAVPWPDQRRTMVGLVELLRNRFAGARPVDTRLVRARGGEVPEDTLIRLAAADSPVPSMPGSDFDTAGLLLARVGLPPRDTDPKISGRPDAVDNPALLRTLLRRSDFVLLSLDGAVRNPDSGISAAEIANGLRETLIELTGGAPLPPEIAASADPWAIVRFAASIGAEVEARMRYWLAIWEMTAADGAGARPWASGLMKSLRRDGIPVVVVGRADEIAVARFMMRQGEGHPGGGPGVLYVSSKDGGDIRAVSDSISAALRVLADPDPADGLFIGDIHDVWEAKRLGLRTIGVAHRPEDVERLAAQRPDLVLTDLGPLAAEAARPLPLPPSPARTPFGVHQPWDYLVTPGQGGFHMPTPHAFAMVQEAIRYGTRLRGFNTEIYVLGRVMVRVRMDVPMVDPEYFDEDWILEQVAAHGVRGVPRLLAVLEPEQLASAGIVLPEGASLTARVQILVCEQGAVPTKEEWLRFRPQILRGTAKLVKQLQKVPVDLLRNKVLERYPDFPEDGDVPGLVRFLVARSMEHYRKLRENPELAAVFDALGTPDDLFAPVVRMAETSAVPEKSQLIHRDIKRRNVLIDAQTGEDRETGEVECVIDLGLMAPYPVSYEWAVVNHRESRDYLPSEVHGPNMDIWMALLDADRFVNDVGRGILDLDALIRFFELHGRPAAEAERLYSEVFPPADHLIEQESR